VFKSPAHLLGFLLFHALLTLLCVCVCVCVIVVVAVHCAGSLGSA